jgi:SAM-dependent methyltransferase
MPIDIDDYSAKYAEQYQRGGFETVLVAVRRERVLQAMARYPHRRVLEVGCGLDPLFTSCDGWDEFTVVEPSAEFAGRARSLAAGRPRVRVIQAFFEDAASQLPPTLPDFVAVSSLLHEVENPRRLLGSIRAACATDTMVHINVPNVRSFHRLLALEMGVIADVFEESELERRFQRQTRFDMNTLVRMVEEEGFTVRQSGSYFVKPFTHAQMQAMLEAGIIDDRVIRGLAAMTTHLPEIGSEIFVDVKRG